MGFQLAGLEDQFEALAEISEADHGRLVELVSKILNGVRNTPVVEAAQRDEEGKFASLESLLIQLRYNLFEFSELLTAQYLTPVKPSRLSASW